MAPTCPGWWIVSSTILDFSTTLLEEDRHRYLTAQAAEDVALPSWVLSDGTLRMLALTLLAYVEDLSGSYLIEEPENGIHPKAMESVFQSLSSVYDAQILCAPTPQYSSASRSRLSCSALPKQKTGEPL